jgi:hypothetical protein
MLNYNALPDLSEYESPAARKVAKLAEEWAAKFQEVGAVETQVEEARQALEGARNRDREARAVAERRGKADPGKPNEEQAHNRLQELEDRLGVVRQVLSLVEADLGAALLKHAPQIAEEARSKRLAEVERYAELAPQLREAHDRERFHGGVERWTITPNAYFSALPALSAVLSIPMTIAEPPPDVAESEGTVRLVG